MIDPQEVLDTPEDYVLVGEESTKLQKDKDGKEEEVPDGLKGKVIPLDMVQKLMFQSEPDSILLKNSSR